MIDSGNEQIISSGFNFPDLTALLDVIFILLVFLLLTANAVPKVLEVNLPEDARGQSENLDVSDHIAVTLFAESDRWALGKTEYRSWDAFIAALNEHIVSVRNANENQQASVVLAGDKDVPLEKLMKLFVWLQSKNVATAQILMQQSNSQVF